MADTKETSHVTSYEVVIWAYDAAPDAEEIYYVWMRGPTTDLAQAKEAVQYHVDELSAVGGAVYSASKELVYGRGLTMDYPDSQP